MTFLIVFVPMVGEQSRTIPLDFTGFYFFAHEGFYQVFSFLN